VEDAVGLEQAKCLGQIAIIGQRYEVIFVIHIIELWGS
jgi:hypothetical protein